MNGNKPLYEWFTVHISTMGERYRGSRLLRGSTAINSDSRAVQTRPDDPHITDMMKSNYFPSVNRTFHIHTEISDESIGTLKSTDEMESKTLYANGFPYDKMVSRDLSNAPGQFEDPVRAYR